ncbi:MAG: hypothetical protein RML36_14940 [Anaerolineae bacterium]|nr:hypothetical protein [Anaerolineae bacterium]MDW8100768.1 hypothetical protein [Anaerolineae bacterium]
MKRVLIYGLAYLLWAVTALLGALGVAVIRDTYQRALLLTSWHRYTLNAIDKFATVFLALALVVLLIFWEHHYRTGVQRGQLLQRFCLMTAIELGVLFLAHAVGFTLQRPFRFIHEGGFYLLLEMSGLVVFAWLASRLSHRRTAPG